MKTGQDKNSEEYLDRDNLRRIAALECAIARAAQDGGLSGDSVDIYLMAKLNYNWLKGDANVTEAPIKEKLMKKGE